MKKACLVVLSLVVLFGCDRISFRKSKGGMPYQVFSDKNGKKIVPGNIIKYQIVQKINDSVYFSSYGKLPLFRRVNETSYPYDISEIWDKLKTGDSIVTIQMMDTFIKRNPQSIPPQFKNGDRVITCYKILTVFPNDSLAMIENEKDMKEYKATEAELLAKYISDKKINAQKTPNGAFVEIIKPGEGNLIDSGKYISVMYKGTSFSGKVFDSNLDSSFHHTDPLSFVVGGGSMMKGFEECMKFLRNGAEAKIYIPSMLAYGPNPQSPDIKPFENLMFDIKVIDVQDKAPAPPQPVPMPKVDSVQKKK